MPIVKVTKADLEGRNKMVTPGEYVLQINKVEQFTNKDGGPGFDISFSLPENEEYSNMWDIRHRCWDFNQTLPIFLGVGIDVVEGMEINTDGLVGRKLLGQVTNDTYTDKVGQTKQKNAIAGFRPLP